MLKIMLVGGFSPLPNGRCLNVGERGLSIYRAEIRRINKEAKSAASQNRVSDAP